MRLYLLEVRKLKLKKLRNTFLSLKRGLTFSMLTEKHGSFEAGIKVSDDIYPKEQ